MVPGWWHLGNLERREPQKENGQVSPPHHRPRKDMERPPIWFLFLIVLESCDACLEILARFIFLLQLLLLLDALKFLGDSLLDGTSFLNYNSQHCDGGWSHFDFLGFHLWVLICHPCQGFCSVGCFMIWATFWMNPFCTTWCAVVNQPFSKSTD